MNLAPGENGPPVLGRRWRLNDLQQSIRAHGNILVCHNTHTNTLFGPMCIYFSSSRGFETSSCMQVNQFRMCPYSDVWLNFGDGIYTDFDVALTKEKLPIRRRRRRRRRRRWTKLPIIAPYIYDARHHAHPYILSTTVLSDTCTHVYYTPSADIPITSDAWKSQCNRTHVQTLLKSCPWWDKPMEHAECFTYWATR